jgi:plasmid stabilization system protein ParE
MTLHVVWSKLARAEFEAIDARYAQIDSAYADRIGDALIAAAYFLAEWPQAGPQILTTKSRKWRVKTTPYIILYQPELATLNILHVVHHNQDWQRFL